VPPTSIRMPRTNARQSGPVKITAPAQPNTEVTMPDSQTTADPVLDAVEESSVQPTASNSMIDAAPNDIVPEEPPASDAMMARGMTPGIIQVDESPFQGTAEPSLADRLTQRVDLDEMAMGVVRRICASGDAIAIAILGNALSYMANMKVGSMLSVSEQSAQQASFYKTLRDALRLQSNERFTDMFNLLVYLFKTHGTYPGVFSDQLVNRHANSIPIPQDQYRTWGSLLQLLSICSEHTDRAIRRRMMNLQKSLPGLSEQERQRLSGLLL